jgi:hypothetical protein
LIGLDVDGDGRKDLVSADPENRATVFLNQGGGTFVSRSYCVGSEAMSVAPADFNGDGKMDLAVACNGATPGYVAVLAGSGDSLFVGDDCPEFPEPPVLSLALVPNPTRGSFHVGFSLRESGLVEIAVFDVEGRRVAAIPKRIYSAGVGQVAFNGSDWIRSGNAGVFFVRVTSKAGTTLGKIVLLR